MSIVGKNLTVVLDLGDGREYRMDGGIVRSIDMSMTHDDLTTFNMDITGPAMQIVGPSRSEVSINGIVTDGALDALFSYDPDEEKIEASGIQHGVDFCRYCGSDWTTDQRGNCGACGGTHRSDLRR